MSTARRRIRLWIAVCALFALAPSGADAAFGDITLVGQLPLPNSTSICDVWGYSPGDGNHYAIVGNWFSPSALYIVDVTNPAAPSLVTTVTGVPGFDHKVYRDYVYSCDGNSVGKDSRIVDISNPASPVILPTAFQSAHNISISDNGVMSLEFSGITFFDVFTDPTNPDSLWRDNTGDGHDSTPKGDLVYDFHGYMGFRLWDVTNPAVPVPLESFNDPMVTYFHSGDTDKTGRYLYVCDELSQEILNQPDIIVYDMNTSPPTRINEIRDANATVHNLYVVNDLALVSHYADGFKTIDVRDPANPVVADEYDTSVYAVEGYDGCFGVYPYAPTGLVYVSDWDNGLYIFAVEGHNGPPTSVRETPQSVARLHQNYPNPFNPTTTIAFELSRETDVTLRIFDVQGRVVSTLVNGKQSEGPHEARWDGTNDAGLAVSSGVYFYRLDAGATTTTRRMVLLK